MCFHETPLPQVSVVPTKLSSPDNPPQHLRLKRLPSHPPPPSPPMEKHLTGQTSIKIDQTPLPLSSTSEPLDDDSSGSLFKEAIVAEIPVSKCLYLTPQQPPALKSGDLSPPLAVERKMENRVGSVAADGGKKIVVTMRPSLPPPRQATFGALASSPPPIPPSPSLNPTNSASHQPNSQSNDRVDEQGRGVPRTPLLLPSTTPHPTTPHLPSTIPPSTCSSSHDRLLLSRQQLHLHTAAAAPAPAPRKPYPPANKFRPKQRQQSH